MGWPEARQRFPRRRQRGRRPWPQRCARFSTRRRAPRRGRWQPHRPTFAGTLDSGAPIGACRDTVRTGPRKADRHRCDVAGIGAVVGRCSVMGSARSFDGIRTCVCCCLRRRRAVGRGVHARSGILDRLVGKRGTSPLRPTVPSRRELARGNVIVVRKALVGKRDPSRG